MTRRKRPYVHLLARGRRRMVELRVRARRLRSRQQFRRARKVRDVYRRIRELVRTVAWGGEPDAGLAARRLEEVLAWEPTRAGVRWKWGDL